MENCYLITYRPPRPTFVGDASPEESAAVERHFEYLKARHAAGKLVLAGRVEDGRIGIALVRADSLEAARSVMENDPAVVAGVFSAELQPFRLALGGRSGP